jgi:hypothetical protein
MLARRFSADNVEQQEPYQQTGARPAVET